MQAWRNIETITLKIPFGEVLKMAKLFIAGQEMESATGEVTKVMNPSSGSVVDTVSKGNRDDVRKAVDAAEQAFKKWSKVAPAQRGEVLHKGAQAISAHIDELARSLTKEQGKPIKEARMEIRRFQHTLEYYAGLGKNLRS